MTTTPKALPAKTMSFHNPWRTSLESCITGDNQLKHSEYIELIEELDDLYRYRSGQHEALNDAYANGRDDQREEAQQAIADSLASAGGVEDDWLPIALAQEDELCIVFWRDESTPEHPERYEFDHLEDGAWFHHSESYDRYMMVGASLGPGPSEKAPYTHFKRLHAPGAQSALSKEREVADGLRAELEAVKRDARAISHADVSKAARFICVRSAKEMGIDGDDNWKLYGSEYIEDTADMLKHIGFAIAAHRGSRSEG